METAGEFLRKEREARGKSLEEISQRTHIRPEVLRNLEADLYNFAPVEVYIVGALTAYARALGLDPAEVLERYHARSVPGEGEQAEAPESGRPVLRRWARGVGVSVAVAALVVVALVLGRRGAPEPEGPRATTQTEAVPAETLALEVPVRQPVGERVVLEMSVHESTWVGIEIDRVQRDSALLSPGAWRRWEADSVFSITIGNAGGITLTLDGEPVGLPSRRHGQVVILELPGREDLDRNPVGYPRPSPDDSTGGGIL